MKNGTSKAVLVTDLFRSDGPFQTIAEDFLTQRCSFCGHAVDNEARFTTDGYRCSFCAPRTPQEFARTDPRFR